MFAYPDLDLEDLRALDDLAAMGETIAGRLRAPRRWNGRLRRTALARAIRGSNSIEGYVVALDEADAALDDEPPLTADKRVFAEIQGYRQALGYALEMAPDPQFRVDTATIRAMHFMLLQHDLSKSPGRFRTGDIHVVDERTQATVYTGPQANDVPALVDALVVDLDSHPDADPFVRAAMAHLDLVMVHPFRDGNGRMARALHTLVLARSGMTHPELASIEEWLGANSSDYSNTADYYRALALTGGGAWQPERDAHLWVRFALRAHHQQAQTTVRRIERIDILYSLLLGAVQRFGLPERSLDTLYAAGIGFRIRRPTYVAQTEVDERTASRDLKALADAGLLEARGETKGRHYVRGPRLAEIMTGLGPGRPLDDPYPWLRARLAQPADS